MSSSDPNPSVSEPARNQQSASTDRKQVVDEKPAGKQPDEQKEEPFEPGVEG